MTEAIVRKLLDGLPQAMDQMDFSPQEKQRLAKNIEAEAIRRQRETGSRAQAKEAAQPLELRIVGILQDATPTERHRELGRGDHWLEWVPVFVPPRPTFDWLESQSPYAESGFDLAVVRLHPGVDLEQRVQAFEAEGYETLSTLEWYRSVKMEVTLIGAGLNLFAALSLAVAGIGIANTLTTSVIERTKEIGTLRAIGATAGQIQRLFLYEGALIGLLGGVLGLLLALGLMWPADGLVAKLIAEQSQGQLKPSSVFVWPAWLPVVGLGFTMLGTTVAAVGPARRAARLHPIAALRT